MDFHHKMMRATVSTVIMRSVHEVQRDPQRGLRKLVDLGQGVLKGKKQQQFFAFIDKIVADPDSPYYNTVKRYACDIDDETLNILCTDLGYTAFTYGAHQLADHQKTLGCYIPPVLAFDLTGAGTDIWEQSLNRIVEEANELGVYLFAVGMPKAEFRSEWQNLYNCASAHTESVFCLGFPHCEADPVFTRQIAALHNCVPLLPAQDPVPDTFSALKSARMLIGCYARVNDQNRGQLLSGGFLQQKSSEGYLFCLYQTEGSDPELDRQVGDFVKQTRLESKFPLLPYAMKRDASYLTNSFSAGNDYLTLCRDGTAACGRGNSKMCSGNEPLTEILQSVMPALQAKE